MHFCQRHLQSASTVITVGQIEVVDDHFEVIKQCSYLYFSFPSPSLFPLVFLGRTWAVWAGCDLGAGRQEEGKGEEKGERYGWVEEGGGYGECLNCMDTLQLPLIVTVSCFQRIPVPLLYSSNTSSIYSFLCVQQFKIVGLMPAAHSKNISVQNPCNWN